MQSACALVYCVWSVVCPALNCFTTIVKNTVESKVRALLFFTTFVRNISHSNTIEHYVMNVQRSGRMLITLEFSGWIFETSNTKVHEKPSSGNRVVPCRQRDIQTDGQTDGRTDIRN